MGKLGGSPFGGITDPIKDKTKKKNRKMGDLGNTVQKKKAKKSKYVVYIIIGLVLLVVVAVFIGVLWNRQKGQQQMAQYPPAMRMVQQAPHTQGILQQAITVSKNNPQMVGKVVKFLEANPELLAVAV